MIEQKFDDECRNSSGWTSVLLLFSFSRSVFINMLEEYLGINGLFSSILNTIIMELGRHVNYLSCIS
jgi:hypothetical protein